MAKPPTQPKPKSPHADNPTSQERPQPRGHAARLWLLALLVVAAVGTAGALFVRFQLDSVSDIVVREARSRTGAPVSFDAITTNGLRGIRIENLSIDLSSGDGPRISLEIPLAKIDIDFVEMLAGRLDIERIHADNARIVLERPEEGRWFNTGATPGRPAVPGLGTAAFRVTGTGCTLEVRNIVGDTSITFTELAVDISRQLDAEAIHARVSAGIDGQPGQRLNLTALYSNENSFILHASSTGIHAEDVNIFLPASQHFVSSGEINPQVRIDAFPGNPIVVHLETPLDNLTLRDQPEFIGPVNGTLNILAQYDIPASLLTVTAAEANTDQLTGSLRGSVRFDGPHPAFDLRLQADEVPLNPFAEMLLPGDLDAYGALSLEMEDPASVDVRLTGDTETPLFEATARIAGGKLAFQARDANYPSGEIVLGPSEIRWDPAADFPTGLLRVVDGRIDSRFAKIQVERVAASILLSDGEAIVDPLTFETGGNRFVGSGAYPIGGGPAVITVQGALPNLEDTMFHDLVENLALSGVIGIEGTGRFEPNRISFEATLDATQAAVGYDWWFLKPPGIALQAEFNGAFTLSPLSGSFTINGDVASSRAETEFRFEQDAGKLELVAIDAAIPLLDIPTVGKCIVFPYRITGGQGTEGSFTWRRVGSRDGENTWILKARLDDISLLPEGGMAPIHLIGAQVEMDSQNYPERVNNLRLRVEEGAMPRFGDTWFVGIDREDPRWQDVEDGEDREWRFTLAADRLSVPPWKGRSFEGEAYDSPDASGLHRFSATIGEEGWLRGSYHEDTEENYFEMVLDWTQVPVEMFLEHLELPSLLTGTIDGELQYEMDRDDPATRRGEGWFTARNGQVDSTFFTSILGGDPSGEGGALPFALFFQSFSSEVQFEGDVVRTPSVKLDSTQLMAEASGQFVYDGDMDYNIRVSITPETAAQIPAMREAYNVEGLRVTQQNVDLAFNVSGPMFNPQGSLSELPSIRVALVSSALGITAEVVDIPRKILFDLLKLGGGILGTTR